jgi:hypothetical protein
MAGGHEAPGERLEIENHHYPLLSARLEISRKPADGYGWQFPLLATAVLQRCHLSYRVYAGRDGTPGSRRRTQLM